MLDIRRLERLLLPICRHMKFSSLSVFNGQHAFHSSRLTESPCKVMAGAERF